jgi:predicted  nucleic acid-binding Zn-ribbon protein
MISYLIDGVLLLALLLTSLRVGVMYRELKRLRGYQAEYVEIFGNTSRAADHIGDAIRHLSREGRAILERLEARMEEARDLARQLEMATRAPVETAIRDALEDIGTYSRRANAGEAAADADAAKFKNEILKFGSENRRSQDRRDEAESPSLQLPGRKFRMAPSVKTLRTASGNG